MPLHNDYGRLKSTDEGAPGSSSVNILNITYDKNGNMETLNDGTLKDYVYYPSTNKLRNTNGTATNNYTYDANGNMTFSASKTLSMIYDPFTQMTSNINYIEHTVGLQYTADNERVIKNENGTGYSDKTLYLRGMNEYSLVEKHTDIAQPDNVYIYGASGTPKFYNVTTGKENLGRYEPTLDQLLLTNSTLSGDYTGNRIIAETNVTVTGTATLKAGKSITLKPGFKAAAGSSFRAFIDANSFTPARFYYLKDHLGSTRVTVNEKGDKVSYDDYDPWGMQLDGRSGNFASAFDKYKFTGKERDVETGYDYFGARYYDSRIARWMQVDPLAEKYPGWNPYNYTLNNPVRLIDTDGRVVGDPIILTATAVAGAVTIAVVGHTYNYLTNPSYRKSYDSYTNSVLEVSGKAVENVWNSVTSLFSSDEANEGENTSGGTQTKEQLEKAKGSYEDLINEHKEKLEKYKKDPEGSDNKGTLKNAKPEHKEKIINGRIKAIEKQISKQKKELDKVIEELKKHE